MCEAVTVTALRVRMHHVTLPLIIRSLTAHPVVFYTVHSITIEAYAILFGN